MKQEISKAFKALATVAVQNEKIKGTIEELTEKQKELLNNALYYTAGLWSTFIDETK